MSQSKIIPVEEATLAELRSYLAVVLDVKYDEKAKEKALRDQLKDLGHPEITVMIEQPDMPSAAPPDAPAGPRPEPMVRLTIHPAEGKGGDEKFPIAWKGRLIALERGKESVIPYKYYLILRDAVGEDYEQDDKYTIHKRQTRAVSYTVNEMPPQSEIDAWWVLQGVDPARFHKA
ncbi:MAG: hypothetical protein ABL951_05650 [Alphaproteobacteria bacterium]